MGGAGFPTHVKLTPKNENEIDYVIVNGSECEPYLTSDYRMMLEEPERLIGGLNVILRYDDFRRGTDMLRYRVNHLPFRKQHRGRLIHR